MKKIRTVGIILTILAIAARILGVVPSYITRPFICFLVGGVLLSRGIDAYNQEKKEWQYWIIGAGFALVSVVTMLGAHFSVAEEQKLLMHVLKAPNAEIASAYEDIISRSGTVEGRALQADPKLKEAIFNLFQGDASETFIDDCLSMNSITLYQINAVRFNYEITVKTIKITKIQQMEAYDYEAVLQFNGDDMETMDIHVKGTLRNDDLAAKIAGVRQIVDISVGGEELEMLYKRLESNQEIIGK